LNGLRTMVFTMRRATSSRGRLIQLVAVLSAGLMFCQAADCAPGDAPAPSPLTAEQDHRNTMDQLGIQELRPGASADANSPDYANYDESLANPYPNLPDPLTTNSGQKVKTARMWWKVRRPEIVEDFVPMIGAKRDALVFAVGCAAPHLFGNERVNHGIHVGGTAEVRRFIKHAVQFIADIAQMDGVDACAEAPGDAGQIVIQTRPERTRAITKSVGRRIRHRDDVGEILLGGDDAWQTEHRKRRIVGVNSEAHARLLGDRCDGFEEQAQVSFQPRRVDGFVSVQAFKSVVDLLYSSFGISRKRFNSLYTLLPCVPCNNINKSIFLYLNEEENP